MNEFVNAILCTITDTTDGNKIATPVSSSAGLPVSVAVPTNPVFQQQEVEVTNVSQIIATAVPNYRAFLLIQNKDAAGIVYITFDSGGALGQGVRLLPGETLQIEQNCSDADIYAIGSIASNTNVNLVQGIISS